MKIKRLAIISLVAILLAMPAVARGEDAPPGLTGGPLEISNASFVGEATGDSVSRGVEGVAGVGDVNGDGYADVLIGAPLYNSDQGRAYLFLGGPGGWGLDQGLNSADAIYTGEGTYGLAGWSVAGAGDVNGDGYDDLLIGALAVGAYLVLGSSSPSSISLSNADAIYTPENTGDQAGWSVAGAGDVNGDGYADMLIGARFYGDSNTGRAYLVLGSSSPSDTPLANADAIYTGENTGDYAGSSVAGAGDVNGDGYADMLVGAYSYNSGQGRAYLVLGSSSPSSTSLANADSIYTGEDANDGAGRSVAGAGDVNGDGYADLLVSAPWYGSSNVGRAYLMLGSSSPSSISLANADIIYTGENAEDSAGRSVAGAGDVNGDGYADLLIGAPADADSTGRAYLVLGASTPYSGTLGSADAIYTGENDNDQAGYSVAGAGDVDGDGYTDLLIGAWGYDSERGKVYLLFSDYDSATAARYRAIQTDTQAPVAVGASGVTVDYGSAESGSIYVTRHYRNTCGTDFATNGLLWTVDSQRGIDAKATLTFKYNDTQIAGMNESNLKLWYRERPCQEWVQDAGATLDQDHNRITSSAILDPHREYTIAPEQPDPTRLSLVGFGAPHSSAEPLWQVLLAALLVVVLVGGRVYLWRRENRRGSYGASSTHG